MCFLKTESLNISIDASSNLGKGINIFEAPLQTKQKDAPDRVFGHSQAKPVQLQGLRLGKQAEIRCQRDNQDELLDINEVE